jgi:hypothetical protein
MAPNRLVLCLHCGQYVTRKRETEHRKLSIAPYTLSPPRRPSRLRRVTHIQLDHGDTGQGSVGVPDTDNVSPEETNPQDDQADNSVEVLLSTIDRRWRGAIEEDSDNDEDPEVEEYLETVDSETDEDYIDWNNIESQSGLSVWDQLGESYEKDAAAIGALHLNAFRGLQPHHNVGLANRLSDYDRAICRAFAYKVQTHTTDENFAKIPYAFPDVQPLPKLDALRSRVAFLAGFKPEIYDCCPNSCCCFTGPHANLTQCPLCSEARFHAGGRPRKRFTYIPIIPRLIAFARNQTMAKAMQYRGYVHKHTTHTSCDIFDGSNYRSLLGQNVVLGEKQAEYKYFSDPRDVALGLSLDGFSPFKQRKSTAWPIILFNYNLPPEIRFHIANILSLGIIPGPKKPIDIDSFLWPFIREMLHLAIGVRAFDILTERIFALRAFLLVVFGDIPAMAMIMRMKGHNAISPCRMCEIIGVQDSSPRVTTHYVPLERSRHPDIHGYADKLQAYDPNCLPMRSHDRFLAQAKQVQLASTNTEADDLAKLYGIKGVPILSYLHSIRFPTSFPYDFMHLVWENVVKNQVLLWTGQFKDLDSGKETYILPRHVWEAIGEATAAAGSTIPSAYGVRVPDIAQRHTTYTAEMWSFWTIYLGPVLLQRRFQRPKYYNHFIKLVRLLNICLQFEITHDEIEELRVGFINWVTEYEE